MKGFDCVHDPIMIDFTSTCKFKQLTVEISWNFGVSPSSKLEYTTANSFDAIHKTSATTKHNGN